MLRSLYRQQRLVTIAALAAVVTLSALAMQWSGDRLMMTDAAASAILYYVLVFAMWWTMMMAMMLPTAMPAILTDGALSRKWSGAQRAGHVEAAFALGYAVIWTVFALAATLVNIAAESFIPFTPMMAVTSKIFGAILLVVAGLYQLMPAKETCLVKCQSPITFLPGEWRAGEKAAFRRGLSHGLFCTGCCGMLMLLLFYGGVMEVYWIGGLAFYVLVEKLVPAHWRLNRLTGVLLVAWAAALVLSLV